MYISKKNDAYSIRISTMNKLIYFYTNGIVQRNILCGYRRMDLKS